MKPINQIKFMMILLIVCPFMSCGLSTAINKYYTDREQNKQVTMITNYCKMNDIYSKNIDYRDIVKQANKVNELFKVDIIEIYAHIVIESEFHTNSINTNWYTDSRGIKSFTIDIGLMQINTCWNGVIYKDMYSNNIMFNPYLNIYAGCYVMREKLQESEGNWKLSKEYYNGRGKNAQRYCEKYINVYSAMNRLYHL